MTDTERAAQIEAQIVVLRKRIQKLERDLLWIAVKPESKSWTYSPPPDEWVPPQWAREQTPTITLIEPKGQAEARRRKSKRYKPPLVVWPAEIRAML